MSTWKGADGGSHCASEDMCVLFRHVWDMCTVLLCGDTCVAVLCGTCVHCHAVHGARVWWCVMCV